MANMAMSIFNIGKANARITELEGQLAKAKTEDAAALAATAHATEVEAEATRLKTERDDLNGKLTAEVQAHTATKAELKTAQDAVAALPKKVETIASQKAQQIMASIGQPPVTSTPASNPADTKVQSTKRGFARTQELIALEIATNK